MRNEWEERWIFVVGKEKKTRETSVFYKKSFAVENEKLGSVPPPYNHIPNPPFISPSQPNFLPKPTPHPSPNHALKHHLCPRSNLSCLVYRGLDVFFSFFPFSFPFSFFSFWAVLDMPITRNSRSSLADGTNYLTSKLVFFSTIFSANLIIDRYLINLINL